MKDSMIQDERILAESKEIQSRAGEWIVSILAISAAVQFFFMRAPFSQYAVELFLVIGSGVYSIIANYQKGIDIWNPKGESKKKNLFNTIIFGAFSTIIFAMLSGIGETKHLTLYFLVFTAFCLVTRFVMIFLIKRRQNRMDEELNDDM